MLASITPLGERSRNSRYALTASAFVMGSTLAGASMGALLGGIGRIVVGGLAGTTRVDVLIIVAGACAAAEIWRLPTVSRQVNEQWMHAFRGWVYGFGYGAQLGVGVATVVTSGAVYATLAAQVLVGSVARGIVLGAIFGVIRGASLLFGAAIRTPRALVTLDAALRRGERPATWMARSGQVAVALVCIGWLMR